MGQKLNSNAMRLGVNKTWKSRWFANEKNYTQQLHEDLKLREVVGQELSQAGLDRVEITREGGKIYINAFVAKPGVAIGRGGAGIEKLNKKVKKHTGKNVDLKISEVGKPDLSARILAHEISTGLIRRLPPKLLALNALEKAEAAGAKGIRIWIGGRINGAQQARTIKFSKGQTPLHTLKADIDYANEVAETKEYGKFGIKVWVHKPE